MTEDAQEQADEQAQAEHGTPGDVPHTGVGAVDRVVGSIRELPARPVAEHAAVFEAAHEELRRALDGDPAGESED